MYNYIHVNTVCNGKKRKEGKHPQISVTWNRWNNMELLKVLHSIQNDQ